jgi:hypothetical protein
MTHVMQTTPEASEIERPALRNFMQRMVHSIQLALGAFMSSLGVNSNTKSWEAHEGDQKFGENSTVMAEIPDQEIARSSFCMK